MTQEVQDVAAATAPSSAEPAVSGIQEPAPGGPVAEAAEAASGSAAEARGTHPEASPVSLHDFGTGPSTSGVERNSIALIQDVDLRVKIELGRTRMYVEDVLQLGEGSVVELDKLAGDPVDVFVNDRLVARGEVLVLNDNFCVRISEIVSEADIRQAG